MEISWLFAWLQILKVKSTNKSNLHDTSELLFEINFPLAITLLDRYDRRVMLAKIEAVL